jgi:hypothetical protein
MITTQGVKSLVNMPHLKQLLLSENKIDDEGFKLLMNHPTIQSLDVSGNPITNEGARLALKNTTLFDLLLDNDEIDKNLLVEIDRHTEKNRAMFPIS